MARASLKLILVIMFILSVFQNANACIHLDYGTPLNSDQVICRDGYALGYNYSRKLADWVAYKLTKASFEGNVKRQNDFREDKDIPLEYQSHLEDYDEPIYDQGHLISSDSQDSSIKLNSETFLLSNMAPQLPGFNRAIWKGLENRERKWVKSKGELFVYVGMLFEGADIKYLNNNIPIPTHFYKIIYSPKTDESIAYLFPHNKISTKSLDEYLVSIDHIEIRSGHNYFDKMDDFEQLAIESNRATKQW